jgi:hypothetical protein
MKRLLLAALMCLFFAAGLTAQARSDSAAGDVKVSSKDSAITFLRLFQVFDPDAQEPIVGAEVTDMITGNHVSTSASGHFALRPGFVLAKGAIIQIKKLGYEPINLGFVDPLMGQDKNTQIPMVKVAVTLPVVDVTAAPKRYMFEERARAYGRSHVITPDSLQGASYASIDLREALRRNNIVGNFPERNAKQQKAKLVFAGGGRQQCTVRILVDGDPSIGEQVSLDDPASTYRGVEFYGSRIDMPEEFRKRAGECGTLLLWMSVR